MWDEVAPEIKAFALAVLISTLRVLYDNEEARPLRITLEAIICGLLTLAIHHAIAALGLDQDWSIFAGGVVGFFGTQSVRALALRYIHKRL